MSANLLLKWFVIPDHDYPVPQSDQFFSDLAVSFRGLGLVVNTAVAKHTHTFGLYQKSGVHPTWSITC